ncbi:hypothetical protein B0H10DRAFT_2305750 [Mycena sp. CBHHK59/15]|nr:hypothetical protein B0H10DRAFT_2305750 [Mycena sp. CBHHK59/15]
MSRNKVRLAPSPPRMLSTIPQVPADHIRVAGAQIARASVYGTSGRMVGGRALRRIATDVPKSAQHTRLTRKWLSPGNAEKTECGIRPSRRPAYADEWGFSRCSDVGSSSTYESSSSSARNRQRVGLLGRERRIFPRLMRHPEDASGGERDGWSTGTVASPYWPPAAFLDCSPAFRELPTEHAHLALGIVDTVLPRVYRSYIEAVLRATALALKRSGNPVNCHNVKCQKEDVKNFKQCAACKTAYYLLLAPEVRVEGLVPHNEAAGNRETGRPKSDLHFAYGLAASDADRQYAHFAALAGPAWADTPRADLILCVDYRTCRRRTTSSTHPGVPVADADDGAAHYAAFRAAIQQDSADVAIVQAVVASGATAELLTTARREFWRD